MNPTRVTFRFPNLFARGHTENAYSIGIPPITDIIVVDAVIVCAERIIAKYTRLRFLIDDPMVNESTDR